MGKRSGKKIRFVPKLIFGTIAAVMAIPACDLIGTEGEAKKDSGAGGSGGSGGSGGTSGLGASGGFIGVGAPGFGATGGYIGVGGSAFGGGTGGVDAGGAAGSDGAAGESGADAEPADADSDAQDAADSTAMNETQQHGRWSVTGAFGKLEPTLALKRQASRRAKGKKKRRG